MHPQDIIAALRKAGYSQSRLAREMRSRFGRPMSHTAIGNVIHNRGRSARVAAKISRITGIAVDVLFPGRYTRAARRKK